MLGIDYGSRRIGMAISDVTGMIARPLDTIHRSVLEDDMKKIEAAIEQFQPEEIVIGLPVSMNGQSSEKTKEVINFIDNMKKSIRIPIVQWDERLTTVIGERMLIDSGVRRENRKNMIDKVAAVVILQSYLDSKTK
jgi:putative Holliday junction resolvase